MRRYPPPVDPLGGWTTIAVSTALVIGTWVGLRGKVPRAVSDGLSAVAGAGLGVGGLLVLTYVGTASWFVTPPFLALCAVVHRRVLFAAGGPFRT